MPYYELEFSHGPFYKCIHATKKPTEDEITLNCVNFVASYGPCSKVKRISKVDAFACYDDIKEYN